MNQVFLTVCTAVFRVSATVFFAMLVLEYLEPGLVANYFHPAWVLLVAVPSAIVSVRFSLSKPL